MTASPAARLGLVATVFAALVAAGRAADPPADPDKKAAQWAKMIETSGGPDKIRAAGELGKLGPAGRPGARALAQMCVDPGPKVSQAGFEALEKVWPELYQAGVTLTSDKATQFGKSDPRADACRAIAQLGDGADAGVPFLLHHLRREIGRADDFFGADAALSAAVEAMKEVAPADPAFLKLLTAAAGPANTRHANRALALKAIGEVAEGSPKARGPLLKPVLAGLDAQPTNKAMRSHPKFNVDQVRLAAVTAAGKFGKDGKAALPALKKIKIRDEVEGVRKAAAEAVDAIEAGS